MADTKACGHTAPGKPYSPWAYLRNILSIAKPGQFDAQGAPRSAGHVRQFRHGEHDFPMPVALLLQ